MLLCCSDRKWNVFLYKLQSRVIWLLCSSDRKWNVYIRKLKAYIKSEMFIYQLKQKLKCLSSLGQIGRKMFYLLKLTQRKKECILQYFTAYKEIEMFFFYSSDREWNVNILKVKQRVKCLFLWSTARKSMKCYYYSTP